MGRLGNCWTYRVLRVVAGTLAGRFETGFPKHTNGILRTRRLRNEGESQLQGGNSFHEQQQNSHPGGAMVRLFAARDLRSRSAADLVQAATGCSRADWLIQAAGT